MPLYCFKQCMHIKTNNIYSFSLFFLFLFSVSVSCCRLTFLCAYIKCVRSNGNRNKVLFVIWGDKNERNTRVTKKKETAAAAASSSAMPENQKQTTETQNWSYSSVCLFYIVYIGNCAKVDVCSLRRAEFLDVMWMCFFFFSFFNQYKQICCCLLSFYSQREELKRYEKKNEAKHFTKILEF